MKIVRCVSCDGYGWFKEISGGDETTEGCDWCGGIGYVYRDEGGVDHRIPDSDYDGISAELERLEKERMRELGYSGDAVHPRDQKVRKKADR